MRLWLDPNALASRGLTVADVSTALRSQNILAGAGTLGQSPVPPGQSYEIPLRVNGQFKNASDFENLVIQAGSNGNLIKLQDVGRAELGSETYSSNARNNGKPSIGIAIYQSPGSNALDVSKNVQAQMNELMKDFPPGLKSEIVYDTVGFVQASLEEVVITLVEAIALVVLVIFLFLQNWRATIIPLVAIPVSLVGALAFAYVFGFSLNNLTLFGLILATGLVVDDAIIVVEAIARKVEQGMRPLQASVEAMDELTGAVVSTSLVLMAVFIPVAFFPGSTGRMYQQFALVVAFSIALSTFNALSFSPSISAILLRPPRPARGPLGWFFSRFNQVLHYRRSPDDIRRLYVRSANNQMVPLSEVAKITPTTGPSVISHYNGFRAISLQGREASGYSSGQAIQAMQQAVSEAAIQGVGSDWIGTAREELSAGNLGILIFGFGIIMVFLTLAACPYTSQMYQNLERKYAIVGAVAGLLIGSSQEMIRELKQEQDAEQNLLRDLNRAIHSSTDKENY
ncbi:Multidrug efflux pump subunit AcrB [Nostoc flagelliforme CCNUN1]|uniref:Multidrug efflux pump subunit AcrB n=2 Tax=Nostoc flagelliforme TaxID=1306274 RepID=A0A2K8SV82_9NOSO|nr:Multidrug efflux pump subunit AcrB [Nostoc flagelliforme CCNUN1]